MQIPIRTLAFVALAAGVWVADARFRDVVLAPEASAAAIRQVNGNGAVAMAAVREEGNWADDTAIGGTALVAVACLATWRPQGRTVFVDRRTQE